MTSPATRPALAINIRRLRRAKRLTQAQLAYRLGVEVTTVSRWERGERLPRGGNLVNAARELADGNIATLFTETAPSPAAAALFDVGASA